MDHSFLLGLGTEELRAVARSLGEPAFRGNQIAEWLYRRGARSVATMNTLPEWLRSRLAAQYEVGRSRVLAERRSSDGTLKLLLELADGERVEAVGLPYTDRLSCCVSTQVGCPVGCVFCATGINGFARSLTAGEIVDQALTVQDELRAGAAGSAPSEKRIDHVTFMGMGEPLLNYDATLKAARLLNTEMCIAARHLTVSTSGVVPGIRRLARESLQLGLAVSLHAPDDELRRALLPGMTKWSIADIISACREYVRLTHRRVTFEYCLIDGVNDGAATASELADVLQGLNCHVNLIPFNPVSSAGFRAPSRERVRSFRDTLEHAGIQVTQRVQRGSPVDAACGQLRRRVADIQA